ncbi:UDP-N-acetylmuramoylalanyl-D-glutamate--2,6-diaminopimelate ligase [Caloramator fervidus]|uniref:UDP-N-acetylmuramoyl-L-alanyl-D-glutamate--2,6-diaminopimelate ligase n=1 Tax=Caloramator fervidus TaxID=29344 RepID=A0A1H5URF8_9CLOT|nr:UDP-N-acetylmuramoyl-L-alanyl-D-glutamate--2,6-diaminopimelate ligase [Caloramator fervidus]SEF77692.1 UDP-N-acetylmuramoylalanyl-D-glutamate--2,6-diaminopimelate ligase [Caloramator fervidus]
MKLKDLLYGLDSYELIGEDVEIKKISYNSKQVEKGTLFFCIEGFSLDGHKFAEEAVSNGAVALVVSKNVNLSKNVTLVKVKDTRKAMAIISSNFYNNPLKELKVIGITGTNGKTTSTFMMKSILEAKNLKTGLIGTIYNIIGDNIVEAKRTTPESMDLQFMFRQMVESKCNFCVMEVSSHSLELDRVYGVTFEAGIFTNLTQDHLDFHKTMENYFKAKLKLFERTKHAIINIDDSYGRKALDLVNCNVITFGIENLADVFAKNLKIEDSGTIFTLCYDNQEVDINLHLPGKFNVYNALGCAAAAISLGIDLKTIKLGLESLKSVPGRSEKINSKKGFTVIIDYAHTPDGIENILKATREYTKGKLVILFGAGGDRDKTKRPLMGKAAGSLADFCIVTSDNPRSEDPEKIIQDILPGVESTGCPYKVIVDRKEAIKYALMNANEGDVIVIAGKGHETYQIIKDKVIPFDEKEIVNEFLKEIEQKI